MCLRGDRSANANGVTADRAVRRDKCTDHEDMGKHFIITITYLDPRPSQEERHTEQVGAPPLTVSNSTAHPQEGKPSLSHNGHSAYTTEQKMVGWLVLRLTGKWDINK